MTAAKATTQHRRRLGQVAPVAQNAGSSTCAQVSPRHPFTFGGSGTGAGGVICLMELSVAFDIAIARPAEAASVGVTTLR